MLFGVRSGRTWPGPYQSGLATDACKRVLVSGGTSNMSRASFPRQDLMLEDAGPLVRLLQDGIIIPSH